jgi:hypothetical protein
VQGKRTCIIPYLVLLRFPLPPLAPPSPLRRSLCVDFVSFTRLKCVEDENYFAHYIGATDFLLRKAFDSVMEFFVEFVYFAALLAFPKLLC